MCVYREEDIHSKYIYQKYPGPGFFFFSFFLFSFYSLFKILSYLSSSYFLFRIFFSIFPKGKIICKVPPFPPVSHIKGE
jgi:hypothetical protein